MLLLLSMWRSLILVLVLAPSVVLADLGSHVDHEGLHCTRSDSMGGYTLVNCAGLRRATGERWAYSCYVHEQLHTARSWNCRDALGNSWSGHN